MSHTTANELKSSLTSVLKLQDLDQSLINDLLSDEFVNGAYALLQNEPENDEFMNFARTFSGEQNLTSLMAAQDKISKELGKDGYFCSIVQYVIDAWRDVEFSNGPQLMRANKEYSEGNFTKPEAILGVVLEIGGMVPILKPFVEETKVYVKIAEAVHNQDKKFYEFADRFADDLWKVAMGARESFALAHEMASPLILDLDGDGVVETKNRGEGIYFDHDGSGFSESSGWVGKDDGLLVRDINNNGQIDNGAELFGNNSVLANGQKAANGFEALKDLDSNNDNYVEFGVIEKTCA